MSKNKVLYISYDGMTDSLGQSQVLAYVKRLADLGFEFTIISYDKPDAYKLHAQHVNDIMKCHNIFWISLPYTKSPPILSTIKDLFIGWRIIKQENLKSKFDIVHCRGYISAILGLLCKTKLNINFIFDMRGWWADEKRESGLWSKSIYKYVYLFFKYLEKNFFLHSNYSVSLTYAGKNEIINAGLKKDNIEVIPTCVDFDCFPAFSINIRNEIRNELNIPFDAKVILYSGALGTNYNNKGIFLIYKILLKKYPNLFFIILSKDNKDYVNSELIKENVPHKNIRLINATYNNVHKYLMAGDIGIILYYRTYSSIGRSPTKLGEYWACGLPMISIYGLGDLDQIISDYPKGGNLVKELDETCILSVSDELFEKSNDKDILRKYAEEYFSINNGVKKYHSIYESVLLQPKLLS